MQFLTQQEADSLAHPAETRAKLRAMFPQTRGAFASSVREQIARDILTGKLDCQQAVSDWAAAQGAVANVAIDELVESSADPTEPTTAMVAALDAVVQQAAGIMNVMNPVGAKALMEWHAHASKLEAELKAAKDAAGIGAAAASTEVMVGTGATVKILGVDAPVVLTEEDPLFPKVPDGAPDDPGYKNYKLSAWRGVSHAGSSRFEQGADDLLKLMIMGEKVSLVGPAGTGKTSVINVLAHHMRWPVTRFQGSKDVSADDFVGCMGASNGQTKWVPGPLEIAMVEGHILILDEYDHMPADCTSILHAILEPGGKLVVTGDGGRVVRPHPNFRVILTSNTAGFGDMSGLHPSAQVQDAALLSRSSVTIKVDYMRPADEKALLIKLYGIDKDLAGNIVAMAIDSRKAVLERRMVYPITPRQTGAWARFVAKGFDVGNAFVMAVLNKMPDGDQNPLLEMAQRHLGKL